jgi:hypothetical protein
MRISSSTPASAGPVLPIPAEGARAVPLVTERMTREPCSTIRRPAARAVMKCDASAVAGPRVTSSTDISISGVPCLSSREVRLNETSMLPARATTSATCASTAGSSRASSTVASAEPPSAAIAAATASTPIAGAARDEDPRALRANVRATPAPSRPDP